MPVTARPVIGVSCYVEDVDSSPWRAQPSAVLPFDYVRHLMAAGALPVLLPPRVDADRAMAAEVLDRLDAVVVAGGADVEASRYGRERHPSMQDPRPDRDSWELALVEEALARDLPLLGICRGMQVMAVQAGGTLVQHLPDVVGHLGHQPDPGVYADHPVTPLPGTRLAEVLGTDELSVPTYHHQGVAEHPTYTASAVHPDGTVEAFEHADARFRIAVQWHPEAGRDPRLFEALVAAC